MITLTFFVLLTHFLLFLSFGEACSNVENSTMALCRYAENGDFVPDPCDCSKYFVCEYQVSTIQYCPDGLMFDPIALQCDWPANVDCKPQTTTTIPSTTATTPSNPKDCSKKGLVRGAI